MSRIQSIALAAVVAIVAVAAGILVARTVLQRGTGAEPALVAGTLLTPPRPLPPVDLIDHEGEPFGAERLRGRWSLLFFGFTNCPDVCPVTMHVLVQVEQALADLPPALRPQVVLVSVDPERDTPAQLAAYVKGFSPSFTGVTASQEVVDELARQTGVLVAITRGEGADYRVDHSASLFLIDPNGAMRALFSPPHTAKLIADDYRRLAAPAGA
jgi:protein SCO1